MSAGHQFPCTLQPRQNKATNRCRHVGSTPSPKHVHTVTAGRFSQAFYSAVNAANRHDLVGFNPVTYIRIIKGCPIFINNCIQQGSDINGYYTHYIRGYAGDLTMNMAIHALFHRRPCYILPPCYNTQYLLMWQYAYVYVCMTHGTHIMVMVISSSSFHRLDNYDPGCCWGINPQ